VGWHFDLALRPPTGDLDGSRLSTLDVVGIALFVPLWPQTTTRFCGWWLNFTIPALTSAPSFVVSLYRSLFEEKKTCVRSAFGQYLSPEVIRRLLVQSATCRTEKTDITVMFSDIRDSPPFPKARRPDWPLPQPISLGHDRLVFEHHGTLDNTSATR